MNPLPPTVLTIFGITGDLAKRKLLPAIYDLAKNGLLPEKMNIVGVTRSGTTNNEVIQSIRSHIDAKKNVADQSVLDRLDKALKIVTMDITAQHEYEALKTVLDSIEDETRVCMNRLFYLAVPSSSFTGIAKLLGQSGLNHGCQHGDMKSRLLIEKPFGYDLASAEALISTMTQSFNEDSVYRIDHYLAKETVQNILALRFNNPLFENSWNHRSISRILITASESIGIENRVVFYEQTGALRDIVQSHLLQLVALVTMDKPDSMSSGSIHASKLALMNSIRPPEPDQMDEKAIRGQYEGYRTEVNNSSSTSETFAALELSIDSNTWHGVPILVRTGKNLAEKVTEITIEFKGKNEPHSNHLTIRIQPNEGIVLTVRIKKPGFDVSTQDVQMDYCYDMSIDGAHPDAYERVLVDAIRGDQTLFATSDEVLASWRVVESILDAWSDNSTGMDTYQVGSWGPESSDKLAKKSGGDWMTDYLRICPPKK